MAGRFVLAILAVVGAVEVIYGWTIYDDAKVIFQQIAGILLVSMGFLLVAICVGFGNLIAISSRQNLILRDVAPATRDSGVGPGLR